MAECKPYVPSRQVLETYSEELGLGKSDSKHCHAALVARGSKKVAVVLAAVRTVQFMDRYGLLLGWYR